MPTYESTLFHPSAPLAKVTLRDPETNTTVADVPMLLDSGADVTLIPRRFITPLGRQIDPAVGYEIMGFDGRKSVVQVVTLHLVFLRRVFKGQFLVSDQEWGILGRDVLNHVAIVFNGPALTWDEQGAADK